jgi:hypothetical protein
MVAVIEETLDRKGYSYLYFHKETGDLEASISREDVEGAR